jgi:hypothetical protein
MPKLAVVVEKMGFESIFHGAPQSPTFSSSLRCTTKNFCAVLRSNDFI